MPEIIGDIRMNNKDIEKSRVIIDALSEQITALLDLMQECSESTDIKTIKTAAEMCVTLYMDLMAEVDKIALVF